MRWTPNQVKLRRAYQTNQYKIVRKFLFLPLCIKGDARWLEYATIEYKADYFSRDAKYYWRAMRFIG